ncbi:hypothetical protein HN014_13290 [Aquimarina sp. TRL1]|uniref:hypothetical protein n=1 Tax=Aquimarina sp. (strain TRL1) TaxID=2736252 RepID=UPI00158DE54E|nr:hypothetical protein [Aquimarina sp. TRL1]QKX05840.1 hypothetical protein HN014_13290 [Aquimarina sp. TRL1]
MKILTRITLLTFMGLFTSCFGQKEEHIYLAGWEAEFNGDEQCQKFLETQVVDKETASTIWSSIELVFKDGELIKAYNSDEGHKTERKLNENEIGFEFQKLVPNQIYSLNQVSSSESYLGGETPEEFNIPTFEFTAPFQYLGKFSKTDEAFNWLPFDLHIAAPVYLNFDKLFIDYSDPLNPKVLDIEELKQTDNSYDDLKSDSEIVYEKVYLKTEKETDFVGIGHTGVPSWIQNPDIPACPKSNKTMKLLCQLTYNGVDNIKTKRTNVKPEDEWYKQYFENMNFWGDGDLYIFFEPDSKIMCFIIQHT